VGLEFLASHDLLVDAAQGTVIMVVTRKSVACVGSNGHAQPGEGLKGTVSPDYNYLKVIYLKSLWFGHVAPDILFNSLFNFILVFEVLMLRLQNHSKLSFLFDALRAAQGVS
jgi:hypothetical protein